MDVAAANASLDNDYGDSHGSAAPATHYLALFKDATWAVELTGTGGIDRFPVTNDSTSWPDATAGQKVLDIDLVSDESTGPWDFDAGAWALMSAASGGNRGDGGELDDSIANDAAGAVLTVYSGTIIVQYETD